METKEDMPQQEKKILMECKMVELEEVQVEVGECINLHQCNK